MPQKYKKTGRPVGRPKKHHDVIPAGGRALRPGEVFRPRRNKRSPVVPVLEGRGNWDWGNHVVPVRDLYKNDGAWATRIRADFREITEAKSHTVPVRAVYKTELAWANRTARLIDALEFESKGGLELHAPNG